MLFIVEKLLPTLSLKDFKLKRLKRWKIMAGKTKTRKKGKTIPKTAARSTQKVQIYNKSQKDRLRRYNNSLLRATAGEKVTGRDIALSAMNDEDFYRLAFTPVAKNLTRRRMKGELDPELAKLIFLNITPFAVERYNKINRSDLKPSVSERAVIAQELYEDYYPEIASGEYDYLLKKK